MLLLRSHHTTDSKGRLHEVADGVYAYLESEGGWCVSNAGVIAGPDGTTLIDCTATVPRALALRDAITSVTPPVRRLVITHHHGDHHYGSPVFAAEATVIAHEKARASNLIDGLNLPNIWPNQKWGDIRPMAPDITFTDRLTLHVGDRRAELMHFGPAHTTGDTAIWLPDSRTLFVGDLAFSGSTPFVMMGSLSGSLSALDELTALNPTTVISGHGPVGGVSILAENRQYLSWVQRIAEEGWHSGLTPLDLARQADLGQFASLPEPERLVANVHRAYLELEGAPIGARLPIPQIVAEMVEYNGGAPLTCLA